MAVANPATRTVPAGSAVGIEVVPGGVDGREDRDGVVRQPLARWGEAHPATDGLEQRGPTSRASAAICCDTVDVVTPSCSETSRIEPTCERRSSISSRRRSTR